MDYTSLAIGAAVGTGANLLYRTKGNPEIAMNVGKGFVTMSPAWLVLPIGGAWLGQTYLSSMSPSIPAWGWAAIGANLSVMFLTEPLLKAVGNGGNYKM